MNTDHIRSSSTVGFSRREDPELVERIALYDRLLAGIAVVGAIGTVMFGVFLMVA